MRRERTLSQFKLKMTVLEQSRVSKIIYNNLSPFSTHCIYILKISYILKNAVLFYSNELAPCTRVCLRAFWRYLQAGAVDYFKCLNSKSPITFICIAHGLLSEDQEQRPFTRTQWQLPDPYICSHTYVNQFISDI